MNDERLAEILERESKATPGPWHAEEDPSAWDDFRDTAAGFIPEILTLQAPEYDAMTLGTAQFIAAARTDIPDLLAYVDDLEASRARLREAVYSWVGLVPADTVDDLVAEARAMASNRSLDDPRRAAFLRVADALSALQPGDLRDEEDSCGEQR